MRVPHSMSQAALRQARVVLVALATCGSFLSGLAEEDARVVILKPQVHDITIGETEVVILIQGVEDELIDRADVLVDAAEAATLRRPPWRAKVDAGNSPGPRTFSVVVHLKDGRVLRQSLTTRPAGLSTVDVRLVNLAVTVTGPNGRALKGLPRNAFSLLENDHPIKIERWDDDVATLAVALVIDTSLTMEGRKLTAAKNAAQSFVRSLNARDLVSVISFSESSHVESELSTDHRRAIASIQRLEPGGGTALYDAVFDAGKHLTGAPPAARKIAVILSDGRDESASGLEPGSFHTLEEAIRRGHKAGLLLFTIGLGAGLEEQPDYTGRLTTAEVLRRMAVSTGGRFFRIRRSSRLTKTYRDILEELRNQYHIAFSPSPARPGETWRKLEVKVARPKVEVRTRAGYFVN